MPRGDEPPVAESLAARGPSPAGDCHLSVVIPAFNEEPRLGASLESIFSYLRQRALVAEVLVVDDGSTDGTASLVASLGWPELRLLVQERNLGKGAALKRGVLASRGRRVLLTDADLSTPITELELLEASLAEAEVVVGSRAVATARITARQPWYRETMGKTFNLLLRWLGLARMKDTQCGFKLLEGEAARRLFAAATIERFAYDVEVLLLAELWGLRVAEVGVRWANSPSSRVSPLRDSVRMLWDVVRLRWRHRRRRAPQRSVRASSEP